MDEIDKVFCLEGHICQQLNSCPSYYHGGGISCDKCDQSVNYEEEWFHHCPQCKTDFCQSCSGEIDPEKANPAYWKTWKEMNTLEIVNSFFPVVSKNKKK